MKKLLLTILLILALVVPVSAFPPIPILHWGSAGDDILPSTDGSYDLGSSSYEWQDLYIDGTAYLDAVDIDSGNIDGTTIGSTTPAEAQIKFATVEKSADSVTLSVAECSGTLITNRGWDGSDDQTFTLPEADDSTAEGLKFKFLAVVASGGTADTYFDTEGSTTNVYLDGTAIGNGERVWTEEVAIGESIVCHAATIDGTTYDWYCDSINGIWADKGS